MTIFYTDGMDSYSSVGAATVKATSFTNTANWSYLVSGGFNGGGALQCTEDDNFMRILLKRTIPATNTTPFRVRFKFKSSSPPAAADIFLNAGLNNTVNKFLDIDTNGFVRGYGFAGGLRGTGSINVCDNAWHDIEVESLSNIGAGTVKVWVDGILQFDGAGSGNNYTSMNDFRFGTPDTDGTFDDIIIWDNGTGVSGQMGPVVIETIRPNANGTTNDFAVSGAASNYEAVDEIASDGDTSFIFAVSGNKRELHGYPGLSNDPQQIVAAVHNFVGATSIGTTRTIRGLAYNGGTVTQTSIKVSSNSYQTYQAAFKNNPNTGTSFTKATLSVTEFGVSVV